MWPSGEVLRTGSLTTRSEGEKSRMTIELLGEAVNNGRLLLAADGRDVGRVRGCGWEVTGS